MQILKVKCYLAVGLVAISHAFGAFASNTLNSKQQTDRFGQPAAESASTRVIRLLPNARYVNVKRGEIVTISKEGKAFTWSFQTFNELSFDLAQIAPKDFAATQIRVFVSPGGNEISGTGY